MKLPRPSARDLRLSSGLVLLFYVALHLVNHSLGLVSVAVAELGLTLALRIWHSVPGTLMLYGAAGTHLALAFHSIYARRTLRMAPLDLLRIGLGLGIPTLLIGHAIGTRLAWEALQQSPQYTRVVWSLWSAGGQGLQLALLVPGWLHGCLGIHLAFRQRPLYHRWHWILFAMALLLPVLGGLGFLAMGKELAADLSRRARLDAGITLNHESAALLLRVREALLAAYGAAIAAVFAARGIRRGVERHLGALITIEYPHRTVHVPRGWSVLEASRSHHIEHVSMCGGRARCSTCRVFVARGDAHCSAPDPEEQATLTRIGAGVGVRLACRLRPSGNIAIVPLLRLGRHSSMPVDASATVGIDREVVLIHIEWRNRDALAGQVLPQDAVLLTRLFIEAVSATLSAVGGTECDQGSSSTVAIFDLGDSPDMSSRNALAGAKSLDLALSELAGCWQDSFGIAPDFALRMHVGHAVVGETGIGRAHRLTAAGPVVEALGRLLEVAGQQARVLVSTDVLLQAGARPEDLRALAVRDLAGVPRLSFVALPCLAGLEAVFDH
ncbi:MAG: 2Fe-2S iron-sulfur cluster-binding protein [Caldimonas sp.]